MPIGYDLSLAHMKSVTLLVILWLLLSVVAPAQASAPGGNPPPGASAQAVFTADRFDWREMVPYLFVAATQPTEQGIQTVLENSNVLRVYVANEVRAECKPDKHSCPATRDMLEKEVIKRIGDIAREGIFSQHKNAIVDYKLARQPFPFSEIAAVKSEKHPDAYFMLALSDRSYTAAQVQAKYGAPYDTTISQWYSVFKYRLESADYTSKAMFEIDPVDGAVIKIAISLKPKRPKNRH